MTPPTATKLAGWEFFRQVLKSPRLVVAPMVDHSELAWRMLSRAHKAELCYTPMFNAGVFCRDPKYRADHFSTCPEDRPLIVQFCANDPNTLLEAARHIEDECDAVDINLGCPQGIAKRGHYGAFLMEDWELLASMVSTLHKELKVPVTCKIRVFEDLEKTISYAKMLEKAGAQMLTVHGRTREMKGHNTGIANWETVKAIREAVGIPVLCNGNVLYLEDVERCLEYTGCAGVMTAEANLYNPALFDRVHLPMWQIADEYLEMCRRYSTCPNIIRAHLFKIYYHALPLYVDIRKKLAEVQKFEEFEGLVADLNVKLKKVAQDHEAQGTAPPDPEDQSVNAEGAVLSVIRQYPYWVCHARTRPLEDIPESKRKASEMELDEAQAAINRETLIKARMERKLRKRQRSEKWKAKMCSRCQLNQPGAQCDHHMCKNCCGEHCASSSASCSTHKKKRDSSAVMATNRCTLGVDADQASSMLQS